MKQFKVLVCGGRDYSNKDRLYGVLENIYRKAIDEEKYEQVVFIHGGAKGADSLVNKYCRERMTSNDPYYYNMDVEKYPADWKSHGKSAGPIRNRQMLNEGKPNIVFCFQGGKGTAHMRKIAKEANIPTLDVPEPPKVKKDDKDEA